MLKKIDRFIRDLNHRRIDKMRKIKLSLSQSIFPLFAKKESVEDLAAGILVFRLDDKIGDSITATGFLYEIKKQFPKNKLVVLTGKNAANIYQALDFIDEVLIVKKGIFSSLKAYLNLSKMHYRYSINTSHLLNPQVVFLSNLLRAYRKFTFLNSDDHSFTDHIQYNKMSDHVTQRYQNIFLALDLSTVSLDYHLRNNNSDLKDKAITSINQLRAKSAKIILLNLFAGARLRNFNQQTTTKIVQGLLENDPTLSIVSIGNQDDLSLVKNWINQYANPRWLCFSESDFSFNLEVIRQSDLVITPDTSLVHIASAFKKPLVAIYREDDAHEKNSLIWAPYKTRFEVVYAPFDQSRPHDINTVDAKVVVEQALKLLSE